MAFLLPVLINKKRQLRELRRRKGAENISREYILEMTSLTNTLSRDLRLKRNVKESKIETKYHQQQNLERNPTEQEEMMLVFGLLFVHS